MSNNKVLRQLGLTVHIQDKLLPRTPVMGTHTSYELDCLTMTVG